MPAFFSDFLLPKNNLVYNTRMITRKSTFSLGIFILVVSSSFLGLPSFWKTVLLFLCGLVLIGMSIKITLPKKPAKRPLRRKDKNAPASAEIELSPVSEGETDASLPRIE